MPLRFEPRGGAGFTLGRSSRTGSGDRPEPFGQCLAALGLSWRERVDVGPADRPAGPRPRPGRSSLLLPGETYVEYQLLAQELRPDAFVMAVGYGESATGYIPTSLQLDEGDENLGDWYWVSEGAEGILPRRACRGAPARRRA